MNSSDPPPVESRGSQIGELWLKALGNRGSQHIGNTSREHDRSDSSDSSENSRKRMLQESRRTLEVDSESLKRLQRRENKTTASLRDTQFQRKESYERLKKATVKVKQQLQELANPTSRRSAPKRKKSATSISARENSSAKHNGRAG